jgi:hypothetical protein
LPTLKNPALQADVEDGTLSASCASLACGYENQALRATGENVIAAIFAKNTLSSSVQTSRAASPRRTGDNQHHKNHKNHKNRSANKSIINYYLFVNALKTKTIKIAFRFLQNEI